MCVMCAKHCFNRTFRRVYGGGWRKRAGKSTLRRDLIERINHDGLPVIVIEPYIIAMEDNDLKGKTLKAAHIAESIIKHAGTIGKV